MDSIGNLVRAAAQKYKDKKFLFFNNKSISFNDLNEITNKICNAVHKEGIKKGDRVAIMLPNRPEFILFWFGLNKLGVSMVPINIDFTSFEAQYLINHSESVLAITDKSHLNIVSEAKKTCTKLKKIVVIDFDSNDDNIISYYDFIKNCDVENKFVEISKEDEAAVLYTSGTTGKPKGCIVDQFYYINTGNIYVREHMIQINDKILTPLPLFHMNAQTLTTMGALISGASIVLIDRFHPSTWWKEVRNNNATFFHYLGVIPAMLMGLESGKFDYRDEKIYGIGAGVPKDIHEKFEKRFNVELLEVYGSTEGGGGGIFLTGRKIEDRKVGTSAFGKLLPEVEAIIVDENDGTVDDGIIGELLVRSANKKNRRMGFMLGYLKDKEATEDVWRGNWFHTGDYCYRDSDGYYHFIDRKKNMIRRSGENISAAEIESVLCDHPDIIDSAVVAVPDKIRVEEIKAFIILKKNSLLTPEEIISWCKERLAYFKIPRYIEFRERLPKTSTQKIQKHVLKNENKSSNENTWDRTLHMKIERLKG